MAEADLDVIIRQIAKTQNKTLMAAVKKRRDQIMARAAKAKDKEARNEFRLIAKSTMVLGTAAAKRLQNSAENTADSYRRADQGRRGRGGCGREEGVEEARQEERRLAQRDPQHFHQLPHRAVGRGKDRPAGRFGNRVRRRRQAVLGERDEIAIAQVL